MSIRDFELHVERESGDLATFCRDGPVEKIGSDSFSARVKDFTPAKELTVCFRRP
jgi:hypothetical protein